MVVYLKSPTGTFMNELRQHIPIFISLGLAVYSSMMIKWQVSNAGTFPLQWNERFEFIGRLFLNAWIWTSLAATFLAGVFWMVAMTRFKLSYAYPFTALGYAAVLILSSLLFAEAFTWQKAAGVVLIAAGIYLGSRS